MQTPQVMKLMSAPAISVEPTKMAVQFCVTQNPALWQHRLTGPQQHCPYVAGPFWLFCPQQQATAACGAPGGAGALALAAAAAAGGLCEGSLHMQSMWTAVDAVCHVNQSSIAGGLRGTSIE